MGIAKKLRQSIKPYNELQNAISSQSQTIGIMQDSISILSKDVKASIELNRALAERMQAMSTQMRTLQAGSGHLKESEDWIETLLHNCSDSMQMATSLWWLIENSEDFCKDFLKAVDSEVYQKAIEKLSDADRKRLNL